MYNRSRVLILSFRFFVFRLVHYLVYCLVPRSYQVIIIIIPVFYIDSTSSLVLGYGYDIAQVSMIRRERVVCILLTLLTALSMVSTSAHHAQ